jgi:flagellar hook assembly protein FlgD
MPNPLVSGSTLRFDLARAANARLEIFDLSGRLVGVVAEGELPAGEHEATWTGLNADGRPVAAGVYFCAMSAVGSESRRKMVLLK